MHLKRSLNLFIAVSVAAVAVESVRPLSAREVVVPVVGGIVFVDGRPTEKAVAVRLLSENSAIVATTYTTDSGRFLFRNVELELEDNYFLVMSEPGYQEVRHLVPRGYFVQDSAMQRMAHSSGSIILDLESLPSEKKAPARGSNVVDARQLRAEISPDARKEYNQALKSAADGKSGETLAHLKKAVEISPEYYDALVRLGAEYMRAGQPVEAGDILKRAKALNPNDPIPLTNLGIIQFQVAEKLESAGAGKSSEAEATYRSAAEMFEKALHLNPLAPRVNLYLGIAYYRLGFYDKSEPLLINALALNSQMYDARLSLINIYSRQRRYDEALKQIAEYLEAIPDAPQRRQLEELEARIRGASAPQ